MATGVQSWSKTAATNATADSAINWAEGQAPSSVNDSARAMMASVAKWRDDFGTGITTGGSATAYTITSNQSFASLSAMDGALLCIIPHATSGASPTLAVDGLTAKNINRSTGVNVPPGALVISSPYLVRYINASTEFLLVSPLALNYFGQCRLAKSGSNLVLSPFDGNLLTISGYPYAIPDAGVSLTTGGLAATTLYYIYAYMNGATMTLEASATAYAIQTGTGVYTKSGDTTRTLVGMAYTSAGTAWVDSATQRWVRSYFNDPGYACSNVLTADRTTASTSYVEVNSEIRIEFLVWTNEVIRVSTNGTSTNDTGGAQNFTSIAYNGTTAETPYTASTVISAGALAPVGVAQTKSGLTEGYNYATMVVKVGASTGKWAGGTIAPACSLNASLRR